MKSSLLGSDGPAIDTVAGERDDAVTRSVTLLTARAIGLRRVANIR